MLFVELCHGMAGQSGDKPLIEEDYPERREKSGRTRPRTLSCPALLFLLTTQIVFTSSVLPCPHPLRLLGPFQSAACSRKLVVVSCLVQACGHQLCSLSTCTRSQRLSASGPIRIVLGRTWSQPFSAPFHNPSLVGVVPLYFMVV